MSAFYIRKPLERSQLVGQLYKKQYQAGKAANAKGIPVVLDPVGAGASAFRNEIIGVLLREIHFTVIRGNLSELSFIAGLKASTRGVDSSADDVDHDPEAAASSVAKMYHCIAVITGAVDLVSDGTRVARISNGTADMSLVTGTGCMLTGVIGAYVGANEDAFLATVNAVASMGIAGEISLEKNRTAGTGSLHIGIIDAMSQINDEIIEKRGRIIYEN